MNDNFNDIGKKMPYHEREDYIDALIDRSVQHALDNARPAVVRHWDRKRRLWASVAAVAILTLAIQVVVKYHNPQPQLTLQASESPMDQFLNSISDEEAAQLMSFEIEEIPEY